MQTRRLGLRPWWLAIIALIGLLHVPLANAQRRPSAGETALARQEFVTGVEAARTNDWAAALLHFQRSYTLYPRAETQFNIAGAHRQLGHVVAATEAYRNYLIGPAQTDDPGRLSQARAALRELEPMLPMVTLEVAGIAPGDRVLLDGVQINEAVLSVKLPVEPGAHVFVVERAEQEVARREFKASPETHIVVTAEVAQPSATGALGSTNGSEPTPALVATPAEAARTESSFDMSPAPLARDDRSLRRKRLWIGSSVGLLVAGAVATTLWLSLRTEPEAETRGNLGPGQVVVR